MFDEEPFENPPDERSKTISIRGVNADVYENFSNKIKTLDMNIGDAITKLMQNVVDTFDGEFPDISAGSIKLSLLGKLSISHQRGLVVKKADLTETERAVDFSHCDRLEFAPDVDKETFLRHVRNIAHSNGVRIPKMTSKLILLSKISFCDNVEFYDLEG